MKALTSKRSFRRTFDPACAAEKMSRGDIVFLNGAGHVAIAPGNTAVPGQNASVWGMNPLVYNPNTPIEVTTVNAVLGQIAAASRREPTGAGGDALVPRWREG